jgi:hypothetical protein
MKWMRGWIVGGTFLVSLFLCRFLTLPFYNPEKIFGPPALLGFNPATNWLRYLFVALTPALTWALMARFKPIALDLSLDTREDSKSEDFFWLVFWAIALWAAIASLLSFFQTPWDAHFDFFHEGERLAGASNYLQKHKLWTGIFLSHGSIRSVLADVIASRVTGLSIATDRLVRAFLWAAASPAVALFFLAVGLTLKKNAGARNGALGMVLLWTCHLVSVQHFQTVFDRDVFLLIGMTLFVLALHFDHWGWYLAAGLWVPVVLLYAVDRGSYLLTSTALTLGFQTFVFKKRGILYWALGLAIGMSLVGIVFGTAEMKGFFEQWIYSVRFRDYFYSAIFPAPSLTYWRYWIPIGLITAELLVLTLYLPFYRQASMATLGTLHVLFALTAFFYFRSALTEINLNHVKYASGFAWWGLSFAVWRVLGQWAQEKRVNELACGMLGIALAFGGAQLLELYRTWPQIRTFPTTARELIHRPDATYCSERENEVVELVRSRLWNEPCVFVFDDEPAWYYLLRKPACSRFIMTSLGASERHQKEMIGNLESLRPKFVIYHALQSTPVNKGLQNAQRLALLNDFLHKHYHLDEKWDQLEIYERSKD